MATRQQHRRYKSSWGGHHWKSWADGLTLKGIAALISTGEHRSTHDQPQPTDPSRSRTEGEKDSSRSIGKILIIELGGWTDPPLALWLQSAGYEPKVAQGRQLGLDAVYAAMPLMLIVGGNADPKYYAALRRVSVVPILALTPTTDPEQIVAAFNAGVDDVQMDSIPSNEILARVNALVRRFK
jgi:hypothetical protein